MENSLVMIIFLFWLETPSASVLLPLDLGLNSIVDCGEECYSRNLLQLLDAYDVAALQWGWITYMLHQYRNSLQVRCLCNILYGFARITALCAQQSLVVVRRNGTPVTTLIGCSRFNRRVVFTIEYCTCNHIESVATHIIFHTLLQSLPYSRVEVWFLWSHVRIVECGTVYIRCFVAARRRQLMTTRIRAVWAL